MSVQSVATDQDVLNDNNGVVLTLLGAFSTGDGICSTMRSTRPVAGPKN